MRPLAIALFAIPSMVVTSASFSAEIPVAQTQLTAMRDGGKPFAVV
jgi:hypothetical protein